MARLRFGDCTVDPATHTLTRAGREVPLSKKAFLLLEALIEMRPQVLSHRDLRDRIWPGTFVGYSCLAGLVSEVRQAVGDDRRRPHCVRTVHGVGYAFIAETRPTPAGGAGRSPFSLRWGGQEFPLVEGPNLIGRVPECQVQIPSHIVSRQHSRLVVTSDRATIEDLGSKNGTYVRGRLATGPTPLRDGEEILLGHESLRFVGAALAGSTKTDRPRRAHTTGRDGPD